METWPWWELEKHWWQAQWRDLGHTVARSAVEAWLRSGKHWGGEGNDQEMIPLRGAGTLGLFRGFDPQVTHLPHVGGGEEDL